MNLRKDTLSLTYPRECLTIVQSFIKIHSPIQEEVYETDRPSDRQTGLEI